MGGWVGAGERRVAYEGYTRGISSTVCLGGIVCMSRVVAAACPLAWRQVDAEVG